MKMWECAKIVLMLVVLSSLFACFLIPAGALKNDDVLVNGSGMYLTTGETWSFNQGYKLVFKGLSSSEEGNKVWITLLLNGESIDDSIMHEGEYFVYTRNSKEIFNITADTIYTGSDGGLVIFKPVYQYLDPTLPEPDIKQNTDMSEISKSFLNYSIVPSKTENIGGFGVAMFFLCMSAAILLIRKNR
ncbi:MAG: S-layer protein domain-containing protein [Methanosarcinaceae archaeon]